MLVCVIISLMLASGQGILLDKLSDQNDHCAWGSQYWCSSVTAAAACSKTDWCTKNYWPYDVLQDNSCSVMQQLIRNVRSLARISTHSFLTQNEIAVFIARGCALLQDGESINQCKQLITDEDVLVKLLSLLDSDLSTESVAAAVGVCRRNIPKEKQEPNVVCGGLKPCGSSIQNEIKSGIEEQVEDAGPLCIVCQFVMSKLQSILAKNATEKQIEAALTKVCNVLPFFIRKKCSDFVSKYTPQLVQFLLRYPPQMVCSVFGLCSETSVVSVNEILKSPNINGTSCFLCKLVINQVKSMLSDHTTQDEIKVALEKVCHLLPPIFESVCNSVIETYETQLIQLLLSSFTAEQICEKLKMCTGVQVSLNEIQLSSSVNGPSCFLCKRVINQVKSMLSDHTTQDEIKMALEKVCHRLPPILKSVCSKVIEKYEPQLIQLLLSSFTTEQICEKLKMCKPVQVSDKSQFLMFVPEKNVQSVTLPGKERCSTCLMALYNFQSTLNNTPNWQSKSRAVLDELCSYLKNDQELCRLLVGTSFSGMVSYIQDSRFPVDLCQKADFCEPAALVTGDGVHSGVGPVGSTVE